MKKTRIIFGTLLVFMTAVLFLYFQGCSKQSDKVSENTSVTSTDTNQANNFTDSDSDVLTVDYKDFYDKLSSKGEWVKVTPDEIGIDMKSTSESEHPVKSMSLSSLFGPNSAYAQEVAAGAFYIWKPSPDLAVEVSSGTPVADVPVTPSAYVPYSNGTWIDTPNGWYFQAATPEEEIVHHYGRWQYSPALGWVWIPGRVWSPAWVDWRQDDDYIAWAPMPYRTRIVDGIVPVVVIPRERYVFIERKHFIDPVFRYRYYSVEPRFLERFERMKRLDGIVVRNNVIINRGPEVREIEKESGRKIEMVQINRVNNFNDVKYKDNVINTYSPTLSKVNVKQNDLHPAKFSSYNEVKTKTEAYNSDIQKKQEEQKKQADLKKTEDQKKSSVTSMTDKKQVSSKDQKKNIKTKSNTQVKQPPVKTPVRHTQRKKSTPPADVNKKSRQTTRNTAPTSKDKSAPVSHDKKDVPQRKNTPVHKQDKK